MTKKGHKIEDGRIEDIQKDLNRIKTFEGLKKFLISELELTQDCINSANIEGLDNKQRVIREKIFKELDKEWDDSEKGLKNKLK